jgi:hypothetical protein
MNCKDCKHWEANQDDHGRKWNECNAAQWEELDAKLKPEAFAYYADADDDSGLYAGVITGPMFGCIKFKPGT